MSTHTLTGERAELLETLSSHRELLLVTARALTDEQAAATPTASALCVGGLVKHVSQVERNWADFILEGASAMAVDAGAYTDYENGFRVLPGETLAGLIAEYRRVAERTDELVRTVDLDLSHELPPAPWFPKNSRRSARRVFLHMIAETAQHAGHADIIRESIDGQKTMG
ncbi:MAG: DinB family protein [Mycobacteriaceae bacterium]|nr:DinB family protein [Mycobacteriaceae bacterium]